MCSSDLKAGIIHAGIGKVSFDDDKLLENARSLADAIQRAKPAGAKGTYVQKVSLSSTMGPGVRVDPLRTRNIVEGPAAVA